MKDHVPGNSLSNDIQPSSYIIDSTKSIYIGYVISDYPLYPAGCDNGPALDGLGNLVVWCNNNGCGELTLAEAAADGLTLDYNWMVALSLISSDAPSRTYTLSHYGEIELPDANQSLGYVSSLLNTFVMNHGPRQGLFLDINTLRNRDISNYFLFENGAVADVIQPTYLAYKVITYVLKQQMDFQTHLMLYLLIL